MDRITRWSLLLVAGTGAALGCMMARSQRRDALHRRTLHKVAVHDWESEGGNLAPIPSTVAVAPAGTPA